MPEAAFDEIVLPTPAEDSFDEIILPRESAQFDQIVLPKQPETEPEKALAETPVFNPRNEQISSAPTFLGELHAGRIGSAYHLAKEFVANAMAPTQKIEPGRGKGLLGTTEQIPPDPNDSLPMRAAKAVINVTNRTAAGLTTPDMLPLAVIGGSGGAASRILAGAFGADIASNAPETWQAIQEADKTEPWSQERFEAGLDTVLQGLMLHGAAKHAATNRAPVRPASEPEVPLATTERTGEQTMPSVTADVRDVPQEVLLGQSKTLTAIRLKDGSVITAPSHSLAYDMIHDRGLSLAGSEEGFVSPTGEFLYRDQAFQKLGGSTTEDLRPKKPEASTITKSDRDLLASLDVPPEARPEQRMVPIEEIPKEGEPNAIQIRTATEEVPRPVSAGENQPGGGEGVRPSEQGNVAPETSSPEIQAQEPIGTEATPVEVNDWTQATAEPVSPRLLRGEKQGDLLSSTQTEDFRLVGEKGVDNAARQAEAKAKAQRSEEARLKQEEEQGLLAEFQEQQGRGGDEFLDALKAEGGLPALSSEKAGPFEGELQNIREEYRSPSRKKRIAYNTIFKADAREIDTVAHRMKARGFAVETPGDLLEMTKERLRTGKKVFGNEIRGSEAGAVIGGEALEKGAAAVERGKVAAGLRIKGKSNDLNTATTARSAKLQTSFADAERAQREIGKIATTERRQNAISVWREAKGDATVLADWASKAKGKVFKRAAEDAQTLTAPEIALAKKVGETFDILERRGNTYEVLGSHRDNYVPHVWDVTKRGTGIGSSKLQDRFKFNKARTFETFFDGDQAGFKPKTLAIGKLLPAYLHEMNTVIADRQFVQDVSTGKSTEGTPLVIPRGRVSAVEKDTGGKAYLADPNAIHGMKDAEGAPIDQSGYRVLEDQPALRDWRWANKDAEGNPIFMKDDLAVHPELAKRLNSMMGQSAIRQWYNEPSRGLSTIPRAIAKGLDTAQSVMKREMFGLLAPFHQVQEGTHAVGHTVNPFFGLEKMDKPTPEMVDGMRHGLMLMPEKGSGARYIEGVGGQNSFLSQITRKYGGAAGRMISGIIDGYQSYLFHQYIPALKWKTYEHIVDRNMKRFKNDIAKGEVTEADVKFLSAEQTNAAYGHLNYALLDRNPTIQHILQLGLLAPDFLEARARFTGQALKPSKAGFEQFRAIASLAAVQAGSMFILSKVIPEAEWDWKHPFELTVGNRTYFLRSVPEDLFRLLLSGPDKRREFVSARVNPVVQKIDQLRTGINYRGEKTGAMETLGELLTNYIPLTARSLPGLRMLTETSRNNPVSPLEQLAGSLGLKISRYSPISKTYQLAQEWKKTAGLPEDRGSYPVSKYQQLRYALEDGDMEKAKLEYQKLRDSGMVKDKITSGFKESVLHPFTGSKSTDEKFRNSLNADAKDIYDQAVGRRKAILRRFGYLH